MKPGCKTCELLVARRKPGGPRWDSILFTRHFDVAHVYSSSLLGWLVIVSNHHIESIDEMSEDEALLLGRLTRDLSIALKELLGCSKTYVMQFAEAEGHAHVHFHLVPRMSDLPDEHKGPNIFHHLNVPPDREVPETEKNALAEKIRQKLIAYEEN